jgi:L-alanine-DL-glutamate epimerase-like enolase superfamily enzyme
VIQLDVAAETWPLANPFSISRGSKTATDVVRVAITRDGVTGRGEGAPLARYGETNASAVAEIEAMRSAIEAGLSRDELQTAMRPGAARNALDCAFWDLEARTLGRPVNALLGLPPAAPVETAFTIGLDRPEAMAAKAAALAHLPLVKVKVNGDDPEAQLRAVRRAARNPRLIVDANEAWNIEILRSMQPVMAELKIALLEQPLPAAEDNVLAGLEPLVPICADESCHVAADLPRLKALYQAVNIKLDKTGGLTEALKLYDAARAEGMVVMVGCMVCTSLAIAPAFHVAARADFADLDGPLWLSKDYDGGAVLEGGELTPPSPALWGG